MKKKKMIKFRLIILMVLCAGLLLGAWIVRGHLIHEPFRTNVRQAFLAPCREYIFGTDNLGVCCLQNSLWRSDIPLCGCSCRSCCVIIGTAVGVTAAYAGGIVDRILMKITFVFLAFQNFILAVAVAGMLGTGLKNSVLALGAVYWITYAKLSRSLVLSIRDSEYIRAAKICGAGPTAIIFKYILPNMVSPLIVTAALDVSSFILSMAGLSFLGLGPSRPTAEWGATMSEAKTFIQQGPWCIVFPGLALLVTVVIFNLLGDALRDVIDEG
ncbi:MAG: ABC transporter permease [Coprococcus sp.]